MVFKIVIEKIIYFFHFQGFESAFETFFFQVRSPIYSSFFFSLCSEIFFYIVDLVYFIIKIFSCIQGYHLLICSKNADLPFQSFFIRIISFVFLRNNFLWPKSPLFDGFLFYFIFTKSKVLDVIYLLLYFFPFKCSIFYYFSHYKSFLQLKESLQILFFCLSAFDLKSNIIKVILYAWTLRISIADPRFDIFIRYLI